MNAVFTAVFLFSAIALSIAAPQEFLNSLLDGARNSAAVALTLFCIYAVWMGLASVAEACGISKKTAELLKPVCRRAFRSDNDEALDAAAMNLTCNLLGAGASTPFAVKAIKEFEKDGNAFAQKLLFVLNATGIQLIPSTVIALRASYGSAAAADIFLPSLICSALATILAAGLFLFTEKYSKNKAGGRAGEKAGRKFKTVCQKKLINQTNRRKKSFSANDTANLSQAKIKIFNRRSKKWR